LYCARSRAWQYLLLEAGEWLTICGCPIHFSIYLIDPLLLLVCNQAELATEPCLPPGL